MGICLGYCISNLKNLTMNLGWIYMKIAILTIQSINYGNRLQNYAIQKVLTDFGHNAVSLKRDPGFRGPLLSKVRSAKRSLYFSLHRSGKLGSFKRFDLENIRFSDERVSKEYTTAELNSCYDCFIIGSDQVWNPDFDFNSELEYLPMVSPEKKIAYAASFGVSEIVSQKDLTATLLNGIRQISVRESAGAGIVQALTGREVPVVLDPTLLLDNSDWSNVSRTPRSLSMGRPYIFKYMLGDDANNARIEEIAHSRNLDVIDIMDPSLPIGPSEFVWLVSHSELVCTDSFHASVFALLYHKPLAIFERVSADADMSSRFDTLCNNFGLVGHRSSESGFCIDSIFAANWDDIDARMIALRKESKLWLEDALNGVAHG